MKSREGGDTSGGRLGRGRGRGQVGLRRRRPLARWVTPTVWPPGVPRGPWVRSARDSVSWARSSALPRGSARGRSLQPVRPNTRVSLCHGPAQPLSACLCAAPRLARAPPGACKVGVWPGVARLARSSTLPLPHPPLFPPFRTPSSCSCGVPARARLSAHPSQPYARPRRPSCQYVLPAAPSACLPLWSSSRASPAPITQRPTATSCSSCHACVFHAFPES